MLNVCVLTAYKYLKKKQLVNHWVNIQLVDCNFFVSCPADQIKCFVDVIQNSSLSASLIVCEMLS